MTLNEFKMKLNEICSKGYVKSLRIDNTGIGYTLETLLGIEENNISMPDLGELELKTKRKNTKSLITLFTFNRAAWKLKQHYVVKKYGYNDDKSREALKCTLTTKPNAQGLYLNVTSDLLQLCSIDGNTIAEWSADNLILQFGKKIPGLILVLADTRLDTNGSEEFHYNEAYLLSNPSKSKLMEMIEKKLIVVDLRLHIKENNSIRNRGTAFRAFEEDLDECFELKEKIL